MKNKRNKNKLGWETPKICKRENNENNKGSEASVPNFPLLLKRSGASKKKGLYHQPRNFVKIVFMTFLLKDSTLFQVTSDGKVFEFQDYRQI